MTPPTVVNPDVLIQPPEKGRVQTRRGGGKGGGEGWGGPELGIFRLFIVDVQEMRFLQMKPIVNQEISNSKAQVCFELRFNLQIVDSDLKPV